VPSSVAGYGAGGGHWSDSGTHPYGGGDHDDNNSVAAATAAASDVLRDFTWYSAMLLSHLFALEHAHLAREAAAEEARRRSTLAHSPQLLMRAAMAAANAPTTTTTSATAASPSSASSVNASAPSTVGGEGVEEESGSATTAEAGKAVPKLPHLTTQHRPHILLGCTTHGNAAGGSSSSSSSSEENLWNDASTRWSAPARSTESGAGCGAATDSCSTTGVTATTAAAAAALCAVFDVFYFPVELFPSLSNASGTTSAATDRDIFAVGRATQSSGAPSTLVPAGGEEQGDGHSVDPMGIHATVGGLAGVDAAGSGGTGDSGAAAPAGGAPRVTPEALREAFHTLLMLGQRCATFALTFHGIISDFADDAAGEEATHSMDSGRYHSSEDELRGTITAGEAVTESAAVQQAASASLQFMLQLACSCPCAPLSYAAQLCLAHALAVQPPPRSAAGWAARQQLLRFLPTLQPASRALAADATSGAHPYPGMATPTNTTSSVAGGGALSVSGTAATGLSGNSNNTHVPATQYVRAEDPMLWFDAAGVVHVTHAQRWWEAQQQQQHRPLHGSSMSVYCGPLPATTALPTVQRLLMEEDQYMGSNGSAAAVLQSVLEAVATDVSLNARVIPGGASSLVHTSLRRRRGVHGSISNSSSTAGVSGSPRTATAGLLPTASSNPSETSAEQGTSSGAGGSDSAQSATVARTPGTTASAFPLSSSSTASRLSKAAKRRRALLFALAQSHLLPPTLQLATSKTLLYGVFTDGGECPSYYMLLSLYPDILRAHHASLHYVLFEDGPLSVDERLMVATMAASRHRCEYLVSRFSALLLRYAEETMPEEGRDDDLLNDGMENYGSVYRSGGGNARHGMHSPLYDAHSSNAFDTDDEAGGYPRCHGGRQAHRQQPIPCRGQARQRWVTHGPPCRLRAVQHLIAIAAHTPWTLNENDVRGVLAAGWTIPEVFQLVAIVAQVVPLCSFVMGMFVPAEPWTMALLPLEVVEHLGHRAVTEEPTACGAMGAGCGGGGGGMATSGSSGTLSGLRRTPNVSADAMSGTCPGPATPHQTTSSRTLLGSAMTGNDVTMVMTMVGNGANSGVDVYRRYAGEDNIVSEQRIKGSNATANLHTLWRSQFTWNEVGATLMEQYYPGAATLMSEEVECFYDVVRQLTKADCVGLMSPDYTPSYAFRSLQLYVQNLLGFMVEDYPYNDINKVLRRPAKWFAQVLTMRPETLTRSEVVRWYVPTTPPIGKLSASPSSADMTAAESSLVTHQLKREIELLSVVDSAQGGHRGGIESASAHPDLADNPPPTPAEAARDAAETEALQTALTLQDERVLLLIALATMEARKEGLLHILLRPVCSVLSNM
jgi:sestrin 1/3